MFDVLFAIAPDGTRLPLIDITNPAFAVDTSDSAVAALAAAALAAEEARGPLQRLTFRLARKQLARSSRLVAAMQAADGGYLQGLSAYVMKLGPDNLVPPYDTEIDRRIVASPTVTSMRIRLAQTANLLADALATELDKRRGPLTILDIAGGPSSDALNALILLARRGSLDGRPSTVVIYDVDDAGPAFARAMLTALQTGPLAGATVTVEHVTGSWADTERLADLLDGLPAEAVLAATSEGGLFEYGADADIAGVLKVLRPRVQVVTGSVTKDGRLDRLLRRSSRAATIPRGRDRFSALIEPAGYRLADVRDAPLSLQVRLEPAWPRQRPLPSGGAAFPSLRHRGR